VRLLNSQDCHARVQGNHILVLKVIFIMAAAEGYIDGTLSNCGYV